MEFIIRLWEADGDLRSLAVVLPGDAAHAMTPLVDTITNSKIANLKELRPGSRGRSEARVLFVFDPWRSAILLVAGDKAGS
jgi:hypothetical protein